MATSTDLAKSVLQALSVIDAEEDPEAADAALVKNRYSNLFAELQGNEIAWWDEASIPPEVFNALIGVLAYTCFGAFKTATMNKADYVSDYTLGMRTLYSLAERPHDGERVQPDYF